jgi:hypothetical protein
MSSTSSTKEKRQALASTPDNVSPEDPATKRPKLGDVVDGPAAPDIDGEEEDVCAGKPALFFPLAQHALQSEP